MATETLTPRTNRQTLRRWDPFEQMRNEMNRLMNEPWGWIDRPAAMAMEAWAPRVDVFEKENLLLVEADLPGVKREEVDVLLEDGDLVLRGERKETRETKEESYYRMERACGAFYRRIALPFEADAKAIKAHFEDGVLRVEIKRPAEARTHAQKITVR